MISPAAVERAHALIQSGVDQGAELVLDGRGIEVPGFPNGNWLGPTILSKVTEGMDCYETEIFGPVMVSSACCGITPVCPFTVRVVST